VAEQSHSELTEVVEADSIEEAIIIAACRRAGGDPRPGDVFMVRARVEVAPKTSLPLRSAH
jgi:hypothetical protein